MAGVGIVVASLALRQPGARWTLDHLAPNEWWGSEADRGRALVVYQSLALIDELCIDSNHYPPRLPRVGIAAASLNSDLTATRKFGVIDRWTCLVSAIEISVRDLCV